MRVPETRETLDGGYGRCVQDAHTANSLVPLPPQLHPMEIPPEMVDPDGCFIYEGLSCPSNLCLRGCSRVEAKQLGSGH